HRRRALPPLPDEAPRADARRARRGAVEGRVGRVARAARRGELLRRAFTVRAQLRRRTPPLRAHAVRPYRSAIAASSSNPAARAFSAIVSLGRSDSTSAAASDVLFIRFVAASQS